MQWQNLHELWPTKSYAPHSLHMFKNWQRTHSSQPSVLAKTTAKEEQEMLENWRVMVHELCEWIPEPVEGGGRVLWQGYTKNATVHAKVHLSRLSLRRKRAESPAFPSMEHSLHVPKCARNYFCFLLDWCAPVISLTTESTFEHVLAKVLLPKAALLDWSVPGLRCNDKIYTSSGKQNRMYHTVYTCSRTSNELALQFRPKQLQKWNKKCLKIGIHEPCEQIPEPVQCGGRVLWHGPIDKYMKINKIVNKNMKVFIVEYFASKVRGDFHTFHVHRAERV